MELNNFSFNTASFSLICVLVFNYLNYLPISNTNADFEMWQNKRSSAIYSLIIMMLVSRLLTLNAIALLS